jgi:hypothetical protein
MGGKLTLAKAPVANKNRPAIISYVCIALFRDQFKDFNSNMAMRTELSLQRGRPLIEKLILVLYVFVSDNCAG